MNTSSLHKAQSALAAEKTISCLRRYLAGLGRALVLATILILGFREPLHGQSMSMAGTLQESGRNIGSYDIKTQKVENSLWKVTASFEKTTSDNPYKGQYTYTIGKVGEQYQFDWQAAMRPMDNNYVPTQQRVSSANDWKIVVEEWKWN